MKLSCFAETLLLDIFLTGASSMSSTDDLIFNNSSNPHFQDVLKESLKDPSRRNILRGGFGLASMFALPMLAGCGGVEAPSLTSLPASTLLGFNAVIKRYLGPSGGSCWLQREGIARHRRSPQYGSDTIFQLGFRNR
jgi:hypothetical protein